MNRMIPRSWQRGEYSIDTERGRLPMDTLISWIGQAYWANDRSPEAISRSWENAKLVFGVYHGQDIVGCARVVTDTVSIAYLADVFILPAHRGQGLGTWLMETMTDHPDLSSVRWLLHTRDAHALYRRFGFQDKGERLMERPHPPSPD